LHKIRYRAIATDGVAWSVCLSVYLYICLSVGHEVSPAKRLNRSRCRWRDDVGGPKKPCIR